MAHRLDDGQAAAPPVRHGFIYRIEGNTLYNGVSIQKGIYQLRTKDRSTRMTVIGGQ